MSAPPVLFPQTPGAFPALALHSTSGLNFAWSEFGVKTSLADATMGPDGVTLGMTIIIYWDDLNLACQELLGYSSRQSPGVLSRQLPFQHPRFNQMWCTRIASVKGYQFTGKEDLIVESEQVHQLGSAISKYNFAVLTLQFTRPKYAILPDSFPTSTGTVQNQEWLRYTDRVWHPQVQVLNREGGTFLFNEGRAGGNSFVGQIGQKVGKYKLERRWYQLPEDAVYNSDGFPIGFAFGSSATPLYTCELVGLIDGGAGYAPQDVLTLATGANPEVQVVVLSVVSPAYAARVPGRAVGSILRFATYSAGQGPIPGGNPIGPVGVDTTINLETGSDSAGTGATFEVQYRNAGTRQVVAAAVNAPTAFPNGNFFGCAPGTLLLDNIEIIPMPLHLPAELMLLLGETGEEVQLQYDVVFHFTYFDPPLGFGATTRGHNTFPFPGDGLWYGAVSRQNGKPAFDSYDFTKLWTIL